MSEATPRFLMDAEGDIHHDGGPAFPSGEWVRVGEAPEGKMSGGLSIRDYFAGQALAGMDVPFYATVPEETAAPDNAARAAYAYADAMLEAREES